MSFEFFSLTKRNELFNKPDSYGIGFIDGKYIVQIQKDYVDGDKPHAYYSQETFDEFEDAKEVLKKVNSDICVEETVCHFCRNIIFADVSRIPFGEIYECECPKCKSLMTSRSMGFKFHSLTRSDELFNKPENYGIGFIDGKYIVQIQKDYVDGDKPHAYYSQDTFDEFEDAIEKLKRINNELCVEKTACCCGNIVFSDVSRIPFGEIYECECPKCKSLIKRKRG
ncbi:MAG TPA: hypothetical protein O0X62_03465 [Methanocorpusculum sp.]|nr:hypothetical protein [Methanocorpusculum sp.]